MATFDGITINGEGTQNVFGNTVSRDLVIAQLKFVRGRPSMVFSEDEIDERVAGYVRARNHKLIVDVLESEHAIALAGPPGTGVMTTAIASLREIRPGLPIRLFSTGEDDVEEIPGTDRGYVVRAADEEESRLRSCLEAVRASGGLLVVVGTEDEQSRFAGFIPVLMVDPPPADAVYRKRLERRGLGGTAWPDWPRAAELLEGAPPGDARRLADLVTPTCTEEEVERVYLRWKDELRAWFSRHSMLRDRTLLVAASTIAPAHDRNVYAAALSLARRLDVDDEGKGFAWAPSDELQELLGADRVKGRIAFFRQGYADSVLRHAWDAYPSARPDLLSWLSELPVDSAVALDHEGCRRVAGMFADLAAEQEAVEKIVEVVTLWADDRYRAADLSYIVLARTCLHPIVGGRVRRSLYQWSRYRRTPQTLKLTVARVCQVLGETHETIALTRLKHLITHGNEQVRDEALDVARALAVVHRPAVVAAAMDWCRTSVQMTTGQDSLRRAQAGLRLLLDLLPGESADGAPQPRDVLGVIEHLVCHGGRLVRAVATVAAKELIGRHPGETLDTTLAWIGNVDGRPFVEAVARETLGLTMFLSLAATRDAAGLPMMLTSAGAIEPAKCAPAWSLAVTAEVGVRARCGDFHDVARLWLDAAAARPDLRPGIVSLFVMAEGGIPIRRSVVLDLVRTWAGTQTDRRDVKEDVQNRLPQSDLQRRLLTGWARVRREVAGGG